MRAEKGNGRLRELTGDCDGRLSNSGCGHRNWGRVTIGTPRWTNLSTT